MSLLRFCTILMFYLAGSLGACSEKNLNQDDTSDSSTEPTTDSDAGALDGGLDTDSIVDTNTEDDSDTDNPPIPCEGNVVFADAVLESVIREEIGKTDGEILPAEVEGIRFLESSDSGISDLAGIEMEIA
jgi:hypothetical protein